MQYNTYPTQQMSYTRPIAYTPSGLKGRPVSSLEEARASAVDFDGSVFFFPDLANKCIYTKQINVDGTATLLMYELKEIAAPPQPNYVTREEFENTIMQLKNSLIAASAPTNQPVENKQELKF